MDLSKIVQEARDHASHYIQEGSRDRQSRDAGKQPRETPTYRQKWFKKRYQLFSKFDEGIRVSETMWFSVTPEQVARTVANSLFHTFPGAKTVVDVCGGAGGNTIAFSRKKFKTIYVDIDPQVTEDAEHNAGIYGCENIEFVTSDFADLDLREYGDPQSTVVHSSPEWGGPGYKNVDVFDLDKCVPTCNEIVTQCRAQGFDKLMLYLPKNSDLQQLSNLGCTRVDNISMNGHHLALVAYWIDAESLERAKSITAAKTEKFVQKQADKEAQDVTRREAQPAANKARGEDPIKQQALKQAKYAAKNAIKRAKKQEKRAKQQQESSTVADVDAFLRRAGEAEAQFQAEAREDENKHHRNHSDRLEGRADSPAVDSKRKNNSHDTNREKRARSESPATVPSEARIDYDLTLD